METRLELHLIRAVLSRNEMPTDLNDRGACFSFVLILNLITIVSFQDFAMYILVLACCRLALDNG